MRALYDHIGIQPNLERGSFLPKLNKQQREKSTVSNFFIAATARHGLQLTFLSPYYHGCVIFYLLFLCYGSPIEKDSHYNAAYTSILL